MLSVHLSVTTQCYIKMTKRITIYIPMPCCSLYKVISVYRQLYKETGVNPKGSLQIGAANKCKAGKKIKIFYLPVNSQQKIISHE